ncbi:MAG: hypothetical protein QOF33_3012 [Thermomicrobiales bacterium]|jgi:hypothetical protein|nr:hypothetical protein [Thermomicrobiales bacterium]
MADNYGMVAVESVFDLSYSDLAPLLDELSKRHVNVRVNIVNYGRPAGGPLDMFFLIMVGGSLLYLKSFIESWAAEDAKALREKLLATLKKGRGTELRDGMFPLRMVVGGVRFYIRKPMTDEEFVTRLTAAQAYIEAIPDEILASHDSLGAHGMYWDQTGGNWKPVAVGWAGDICPFDAG